MAFLTSTGVSIDPLSLWKSSEQQVAQPFIVVARYYNVMHDDLLLAKCRLDLNIIRASSLDQALQVANGVPDAFVVMMNPGGSVPIGGEPIELTYDERQHNVMSTAILATEAIHDKTQCQVMRLMLVTGDITLRDYWEDPWQHIRVLNISDLREAKMRNLTTLDRSISKHLTAKSQIT